MDHKEEQESEIEALESIYEGDIESKHSKFENFNLILANPGIKHEMNNMQMFYTSF